MSHIKNHFLIFSLFITMNIAASLQDEIDKNNTSNIKIQELSVVQKKALALIKAFELRIDSSKKESKRYDLASLKDAISSSDSYNEKYFKRMVKSNTIIKNICDDYPFDKLSLEIQMQIAQIQLNEAKSQEDIDNSKKKFDALHNIITFRNELKIARENPEEIDRLKEEKLKQAYDNLNQVSKIINLQLQETLFPIDFIGLIKAYEQEFQIFENDYYCANIIYNYKHALDLEERQKYFDEYIEVIKKNKSNSYSQSIANLAIEKIKACKSFRIEDDL